MLFIFCLFLSSSPPLPSETGETWIVFASFRGGDFASSVHRICLDGTREVDISRHPGGKPNSLDPSVCPDGRILFTRGQIGSHSESIWIMNGDGRAEKQLLEGVGRRFPGGHALPSVSPDGKTLVYVHAKGRNDTHVYTRPLSGGESQYLGPGRYPSWSPKGEVALIRDVGGNDQLFVVDGDNARQLTFGKGCAYSSWSPDGKHLVYAGLEGESLDLFVISAEGGEPRNLTQTPKVHEKEPAWSPNGRLIAYTRPDPEAPDGWQKSIYVIPVDGGDARKVSKSQYNDTHPSWLVMH